MAVLDPQDNCIVIRVVYDGAPLAGKTTSVTALGRGLGGRVTSPAEIGGRTVYFDWLDYTGGLFEGHRIRCQIVSVPGQASLAPRRRRLLETADVVVFVGDSSPAGFEVDRRYLQALCTALRATGGPPVGVVLQANKRDLPDATPLDELRTMVDGIDRRIGIVESVARDGSGIREAFVFAVRLALDRVRELMKTQQLHQVRPDIDNADDLLRSLQQAEEGALDLAVDGGLKHTYVHDIQQTSMASQALTEALRENVDASVPEPAVAEPAPPSIMQSDLPPALPDERVASGLIWPPVDGRMILHETAQQRPALARHADGGWFGSIGERWQLHTAASAVFASLDDGRNELVQWARMHVSALGALSKERCIVLAADGGGSFRLWQIVRIGTSLRSQVERALTDTGEALARGLLSVARSFLEMADRSAAAGCDLGLTLSDIEAAPAGPAYLGFAPPSSAARAAEALSIQQLGPLFAAELDFAQATLRERRRELLAELGQLSKSAAERAQGEWLLLRHVLFQKPTLAHHSA